MDTVHALIQTYKADPESVYNTWFVNNEPRLKAFRAIRRGVLQVVQDMKGGTFGNDFEGSSLEVVLNSITEQKQVFQGAAHPFYWKPKLRIPDIYENETNKQAFGQFLECCLEAKNEEHIIREIVKLNEKTIKGLGPAVASILYFLHPTLVPPFNTAIVNGFNALFADKQKLGSWESYLRMREVIIKTNEQYKRELSNDLGAFSGLLFDLGAGKILPNGTAALSDEEREKIARSLKKRHAEVLTEHDEENLHTEMQYHLLKIGKSLGYDVVCASNDRSRAFGDHKFSFLCLPALPQMSVDKDTFSTISLIDVLWLEAGTNNVVCAFEVEKSTSIYSGILRLTDLAISQPDALKTLFIVMPNDREKDVVLQLRRPAVQALKSSGVEMHYIAFGDLREHCDAICKFGNDHAVMQKIAKTI